MTSVLAPITCARIESAFSGQVGGALGVADRVGGSTGALLAHAARIRVPQRNGPRPGHGAAVGLAGAIVALAAVPGRPGRPAGPALPPEPAAGPAMGTARRAAGDQDPAWDGTPGTATEELTRGNDSNGTVNAPADTSAGHPHEEARR